VRLRGTGEIIAGLPHMLGFHPTDSAVLVTLQRNGCVGMCLRADLPPAQQDNAMAVQLAQLVQRADAVGVILVIVGGTSSKSAVLPRRELVEALAAALADADVALEHAVWAQATTAGAPWGCYHHADCAGRLPDPTASPLAATSVLTGAVTYTSRDELAAQIAPVDDAAITRRSVLLQAVADDAQRYPHLAAATARERLHLVHRTLADTARGALALDDEQVVALALALSDHQVRDACLATVRGSTAAAAEQLWLALTKAMPAPLRAEPATLLAFAACLRGDGALAGIALDAAQSAQPDHRLSALLSRALNAGMPPDRLAQLAIDAAADSERLLTDGDR
jgi:hypothetical protein